MNYKSILFFLGIYSFFVSFFSILNILYSYYFFGLGLNLYLITFVTSLLFGFTFCFIGKGYEKNISLNEQLLLIILSFVLISLLISPPYFFSIHEISLLDSYFESVSGLTTTGFSIIENVDVIDEPLLLWRSSSQWLGGLLFLIATIGTIGSNQIKIKPNHLVYSESSGINFYNNFNYNFIKIFLIYTLSTVFVIFLYSLIDLRLLDSFNLAFTTISSGGFLSRSDLSEIVSGNLQTFILSITLLFPIFNFYLFFNIFTQQFKFKNHQEDLHLISLIFILTVLFYFFGISNEEFANTFLAVVTSISTSGISTYSSSYDVSLFFILLTLVGGSLISTSSGFKYIRSYILLKISYREIYKLVKPINIFNQNLFNTDRKIEDEDSKIAFLVFILFIISIFILSSILTLDFLSFEEAFKLTILTLTNTVTSSLYGFDNLNIIDLNAFSKISIMFFMILGKIEIISLLYLTKRFFFGE